MVEVTEDTLIRAGDVLTVISDHIRYMEHKLWECDNGKLSPKMVTKIYEAMDVRALVFNALEEYGINHRRSD